MRSENSQIQPALSAFAITPNDDTEITRTRALYVGTSGDVKVTMANGAIVTFSSLAAGIVHPISVIKVWSTDTDAEDIVGLK